MKKNTTEKEFKKIQSTSSPGALEEDVNTNKRPSKKPGEKTNNETSPEPGLNE